MSSTGITPRVPRLIGAPGSPLIPTDWVRDGRWACQVITGNDEGKSSATTLSALQLREGTIPARRFKSMDWPETAQRLVEALSRHDPSWWASPLEDSLPAVRGDILLRDLPLLETTHQALERTGRTGSARVASILEVPRSATLESMGDPLGLLDFEYTLGEWLPHRDMTWLGGLDQNCPDLESVARAIIAEYIALDGYRLSTDWIDAVQRRYSWGLPQATLAEVGQTMGLTRERVRQVFDRLQRLVGLRRWPVPALLAETVERLRDVDFRDSPRVLLDGGLVSDTDWTVEEIAGLLEWFGQRDIADGIRALAVAETESINDPELDRALQRTRSKMGLTNLALVASPTGYYAHHEALDGLRARYSRVYASGDWALAGDAKATMLEGAAARQLAVTSPLELDELFEGFERVQRNRAAPALPPASVIVDLLRQSGALQEAVGGFTGPSEKPEPGTLSSWLIGLLEAAEGHVLHRETIVRHAVADEINVSSLGVSLGYNPIVRSEGDRLGLIRLVGRHPTESERQHAIDVAAALRVPTRVDWGSTHAGIDLQLTIGSNFLVSGVLSPTKSLSDAWPAGGVSLQCMCSKTFEGRVKISPSGALVGWSPLITHLLLRHGVREESVLTLHVSRESVQLMSMADP